MSTKYCFLFDSWFSSKKTSKSAIGFGAYLIGMVKTNTKGLCKDIIEKITKYWPGVYYIMLRSKPMPPGVGR